MTRGILLRGVLCGIVTALSSTSSKNDVAVVGCGVLGTSFCQQYFKEYTNSDNDDDTNNNDTGNAVIVGVTKTSAHHEEILQNVNAPKDQFLVHTLDDLLSQSSSYNRLFKNVVFCAPPSGSDDYASSVREAMKLWNKEEDGVFVLTSSGAVYSSVDGSIVNEDSPTFDPEESPRAARLLYAEDACRGDEGTVLRLAGLYTLDRGAHNFFMSKSSGEVHVPIARRPDGILNSLHYDDAAGACLAAVKAGKRVRGETFLISDGSPSTRLGVCESCLKAKMFSGRSLPTFIAEDGDVEIGKTYDGSHSNKILNWQPRYSSFDAFMQAQS